VSPAPTGGPRPARPEPALRVDWTRCDGHGLCAALLPEAIMSDDWGYPVIDDVAVTAAPVGAVKRVVAACPALALRRTA
jgi:ferredoxin